MHLAARKGHSAVVKVLLDNGANTYTCIMPHSNSPTILEIAAAEGHVEIMELILNNDLSFQPNADNIERRGLTYTWAFATAATEGQLEALRLLAHWGADVNPRHEAGRSPLDCAIKFEHKDAVRVIVELGQGVNEMSERDPERAPSELAVSTRDVGILKMLLDENSVELRYIEDALGQAKKIRLMEGIQVLESARSAAERSRRERVLVEPLENPKSV